MRRPALALLLGCLLLVAGVSALDGYDYYQTIEYAGCDQEVYQQDIIIHRSAGTAYNETSGGLETWHIYVGDHCREDYGDIRFTDPYGRELAYYLWPGYTNSSARFCVRLENATSAGTLVVHYGNAAAATTSNGDATYLLFDHFDGDALNTTKWIVDTGPVTVSGSTIKTPLTTVGVIRSKVSFTDAIVESRWHRMTGSTNTEVDTIVRSTSSSNYYQCFAVLSSYKQKIYRRVSSTFTIISTEVSFPTTADGWYTQRVRCVDNSIQSTIGTSVTTATDSTYASGAVGLKSNTGYEFDYITVRAYSAPPPAAITFSGEQEIVCLQPFPGLSRRPTDINSDGLYEDINGNARWDFQDIILFFQHLTWCEANQPVSLFDWNSNGRCDFDDVFRLWSNGGMI